MKKLFLSIACLTALAGAANSDARFFGGGCGGGGCAPRACISAAPNCQEKVCYMEKCGPACVKPDECSETREIAYRKCIVMQPVEKTYPVEIVCRTTTKCVTNEVPLAGCGEEATHFSNGAPVESGRYSAYGAEAAVSQQKSGSRAARKNGNY